MRWQKNLKKPWLNKGVFMKLKKICALFVSAALLLGMLSGCGKEEVTVDDETVTEETTQEEAPSEVSLNFWYTDQKMTDYFTYAVERFMEENPNVTINLALVASNEYLENINTQSFHMTNAVDVYMLSNVDIEKAYLAGLAESYDADDTVYNSDNFGNSAIRAVKYGDKQVAYPLYFDSAFLVYNKAYVDEVPSTFDALLEFSNTLQDDEENTLTDKIEKTFIWPVSDYTFNYPFLSEDFIVGGDNGDDRSVVDTNNSQVKEALEYYQSLHDFFAIDRSEADYEYCINMFIEGKIAFTFAKTGMLKTLDEAVEESRMEAEATQEAQTQEDGETEETEESQDEVQTQENVIFEYGAAEMPDISDSIKASSLSYTQTLVINPYSLNKEAAGRLVKALTCDYTQVFYELTDFLPAYKNWDYDSDIFDGIYANYDDSTPRPKMMTLGDYYIQLEILLHKVWDDDGDIDTLLADFQEYVSQQIN
jgi:ABC-type glycerol-3-phosphate transport system substrate-binding protein